MLKYTKGIIGGLFGVVIGVAQVQEYNELRGYLGGDACSNISPGHNEQLWKLHKNCN